MRTILDENIPAALIEWIIGHEVTNVQQAGLSGISNGELISKIDGIFDLFVTGDKNLRYQQNLSSRSFAVLELPTNALPGLILIRPQIVLEISTIQTGEYRILAP
jgi:hypothetical protein